MAVSQESRMLFVERSPLEVSQASETEEDGLEYLAPGAPRQRPRLRIWHGVAVGVLAAAALAAAVLACAWPTAGRSAAFSGRFETISATLHHRYGHSDHDEKEDEEEEEEEEEEEKDDDEEDDEVDEEKYKDRVKVFGQCAGNGMEEKRCMPGCSCKRKSDYFSGCQPIDNGDRCNVAVAKAYLKEAQEQEAPLKKKVERTADRKRQTAKEYKELAVKAAKSQYALAKVRSFKQVATEAAMLSSVKKEHEKNVTIAKKGIKEAQDEEAEAKKAAFEELKSKIEEAEEKLKQAKKDLGQVKVDTKKESERRAAEEEKKVQAAKDLLAKAKAYDNDAILHEHKDLAAAAETLAAETAEASEKANATKATTKSAADKAAAAAEKALKNVKSSREKVKKWESAVI